MHIHRLNQVQPILATQLPATQQGGSTQLGLIPAKEISLGKTLMILAPPLAHHLFQQPTRGG